MSGDSLLLIVLLVGFIQLVMLFAQLRLFRISDALDRIEKLLHERKG